MNPKKETYREELLSLAAQAYAAADRARLRSLKAKGDVRRQKQKARVLRNLAGMPEAIIADKGTLGYRATTGLIDLRWPLRQALAKRMWSIPDMLAKLFITEISAGTVRSWLKPSQPRAVPRSWALFFEKAFTDDSGKPEVPAVDKSWPGGIQEE